MCVCVCVCIVKVGATTGAYICVCMGASVYSGGDLLVNEYKRLCVCVFVCVCD